MKTTRKPSLKFDRASNEFRELVNEIVELREEGLLFREIDAILGQEFREGTACSSYRIMKLAEARRIAS